MMKRAINLDGLPTLPKATSAWSEQRAREAQRDRDQRARWVAAQAEELVAQINLPQTRASFALEHAECPMNPAECEQFIPRDSRNDYCRWCGGARDEHVLAIRLAQEDPPSTLETSVPLPLPSEPCAWFHPTDSSLGRCRCGFVRMQHDPDAVRRWVVSLQGKGRRR